MKIKSIFLAKCFPYKTLRDVNDLLQKRIGRVCANEIWGGVRLNIFEQTALSVKLPMIEQCRSNCGLS